MDININDIETAIMNSIAYSKVIQQDNNFVSNSTYSNCKQVWKLIVLDPFFMVVCSDCAMDFFSFLFSFLSIFSFVSFAVCTLCTFTFFQSFCIGVCNRQNSCCWICTLWYPSVCHHIRLWINIIICKYNNINTINVIIRNKSKSW